MWFCINCKVSLPHMQKLLIRVSKLEKGQSEILEKLEAIQNRDIVDTAAKESNVEELVKDAMSEQKVFRTV